MENSLHARRAVEALRAGVPNRDAVRVLGFADDSLAGTFDDRLDRLAGDHALSQQPMGLLLAAEFGGGKSHALEYFRHRALERNVAVSKVVISKETQLFDPARLFRAAIDSLEVEDRTGDALADIAVTRLNSGPLRPRFDEFALWLRTSGLNSRFAATVALFEHAQANNEVQDRLIRFWAGGALLVTTLKKDLRSCGMAGIYPLEKIAARNLARERFRFIARLLWAAGYDGWVILLDELELMGRYSVLQRGRSYGELARLLGLAAEESIPGLLAVGAVTPDYESAVLVGKDDLNQIGFRFRARADYESELTAALSELTMDAVRKDLIMLRRPDLSTLQSTAARLADVYERAYDRAPDAGEVTYNSDWQMREYVRSWITKWDLNRLDPDYEVETVVTPIATDYTENTVLERPSENDEE
ncbi:MAG: DUF2791 family P-loop domain-containing protein [Actinobacteria bacterium]|nr:DUF2791 family P-loop domain-containing protein [Actinomycetota bacterium]